MSQSTDLNGFPRSPRLKTAVNSMILRFISLLNFCGTQVEVTKFDALEETHAELKLKDMLWNAIDEWDGLMSEWTTVRSG